MTFTEVPEAQTVADFFAGLRAKRGKIRGLDGSFAGLTADIFSISKSLFQERPAMLALSPLAALIPVITVVGLELGTLLSGSIIVETVFAWPGSGSLLITALNARDYPLVTGIVMTYTLAFVALNLIIDGLYAVVDPRIRY